MSSRRILDPPLRRDNNKDALGRRLLLAVLLTYGSFSLYCGARNAIQPTLSQDLAPVYMASRLWLKGDNPYHPPRLEQWKEASPMEDPPHHYSPSAIATPYPPMALMNLSFIGRFSWPVARNVWLALNLILVFYVPLMIRHLWYPTWSGFRTTLLTAFWLCGFGTRVGLGLGQHSLFAFALILTALLWVQRGKPIGGGMLLALAIHKPNLTVFPLLLLASKRFHRPLISTALVSLTICIFVFGRLGAQSSEAIAGFMSALLWWGRFIETQYHGTSFYPVLAWFIGGQPVTKVVMQLLRIAGVGTCYWLSSRKRTFPTDVEFSTFMVMALWVFYHGSQDLFLLILPIAALAHRFKALRESPFRWIYLPTLASLIGMWFTDASKIYLLLFPTPMDQLFESGPYGWMVNGYRLLIFIAFLVLLSVQTKSALVEKR